MSASAVHLYRQLKEIQADTGLSTFSVGLVEDNIYEWEVMIMIPEGCGIYGGGCFKARLSFPMDYPLMPPTMTFETPVWHPNSKEPIPEGLLQSLTFPSQSISMAMCAFLFCTPPKSMSEASHRQNNGNLELTSPTGLAMNPCKNVGSLFIRLSLS